MNKQNTERFRNYLSIYMFVYVIIFSITAYLANLDLFFFIMAGLTFFIIGHAFISFRAGQLPSAFLFSFLAVVYIILLPFIR